MQRILIIGGNGSGKTTLARTLAACLGLPLVHLDQLYWRDGWQPAPQAEFDCLLNAAMARPAWIIDGNNKRTLPRRFNCCDTVIWLDFPTWRCVLGVLRRLLHAHGQSRPDMGGRCVERFDRRSLDFVRTVCRFRRKNQADFECLLAAAPNVRLVRLKNPRQVRAFLRQLGASQP